MNTATLDKPATVALATTPAALSSSAWLDGSTAPKDGTEIVAIGPVIYQDEFSTAVDSFVAAIRWVDVPGKYEGWHDRNGLAVARMLDDEVRVDYWLPMPSNAKVSDANASERSLD